MSEHGESMTSNSLNSKIFKLLVIVATIALQVGCASILPERRKDLGFPVALPFMRMDATECYYLDDFMPTPDRLVTGRSSGVFLRYYNYDSAVYKIWDKDSVMLAFYSKDNRCWSLFEEYNTNKNFSF